jgi:hypothetical protein
MWIWSFCYSANVLPFIMFMLELAYHNLGNVPSKYFTSMKDQRVQNFGNLYSCQLSKLK